MARAPHDHARLHRRESNFRSARRNRGEPVGFSQPSPNRGRASAGTSLGLARADGARLGPRAFRIRRPGRGPDGKQPNDRVRSERGRILPADGSGPGRHSLERDRWPAPGVAASHFRPRATPRFHRPKKSGGNQNDRRRHPWLFLCKVLSRYHPRRRRHSRHCRRHAGPCDRADCSSCRRASSAARA